MTPGDGAIAPPPWADGPYSIKRHGLTLTNCDSEPVQTPGCIQAHGAMLVLRLSDLSILQASENTLQHLGLAPESLLGQGVASVAGAANLRLVEQLVARRADLRLLSAANGRIGIDMARARPPDLILMDINLPGISGLDAMRILRADPATAHIPIIALSANALPLDIAKGIAAGFSGYLAKPIRFDAFMQALDTALLSAQTAPARAGGMASA